MKTFIHTFTLFFLVVLAVPPHSFAGQQLGESQIFEWWDDGLITAEQANEILSQLDFGNIEEACIMAQVYAQETCEIETQTTVKKRSKGKNKKRERHTDKSTKSSSSITADSQQHRASLWHPHGRISYRMRLDSAGTYENSSKSLQLDFYKFSLHLGTSRTLRYSDGGYEAFFGNYSSRELHSHFPLDTLFGAAFTFPVKRFAFGFSLDTSKIIGGEARFNFNESRNMSFQFFHGSDNTLQLQTATELGQISAWWILGQKMPLIKILLSDKSPTFSWNIAAYIHGDSIPSIANLSKSIQKSRLWATQAATATLPFKTKISINMRIINPLHSDSISGRFKISAESGPSLLHGSFYATCLEAQENCDNTDWKIALISTKAPFQLSASSKIRHTPNGFKAPRLSAEATFHNKNSLFRLSFVFPKASPSKALQIRNQVKIESQFLSLGLSATLKKDGSSKLFPSHAQLQANVKF